MTFQVIEQSVSSLNGWAGGMLLLLLSLYMSVRFEVENARIKKKYSSQLNRASQNKAEQTTSVQLILN